MNHNIELLNFIHKNAQMGLVAIERIIDMVEDEDFKQVLRSQNNEYKIIYDECEERLKEEGRKAKETNPLIKVFSYINININTLTDKSPSHISELMIRGSTMGIIDITKNIKEYCDADVETLDLANRLLRFEQRNVEELKKFL
jgi:hypothetical protein